MKKLIRVLGRVKRKSRPKKGVTAWLVTYLDMPIIGKTSRGIALILNPRISAKRVRKIVELFYATNSLSLSERIDYATRHFTLYPAEFENVGGVSNQGRIFCGRKWELFARKVDNLIIMNEKSPEWTERQPPTKKDVLR